VATKTAASSRKLGQLVAAANRHRVPVWVLVGVKLMETGNDLNAANPFQFEPGTAASTGVRNPNNFNQAANGAAKLLAAYHRQFGSWNAAFEAYNGGPGAVGKGYAYNERDVEAKLAEFHTSKAELGGGGGMQTVSFLGDLKHGLDKAFGYALGGVLGGEKASEGLEQGNPGKLAEGLVTNPLEGITNAISALFSPAFWLRVLEIIGGAALLYMGLKALTGIELPSAVPVPVPV
jgi:hypothetical protein